MDLSIIIVSWKVKDLLQSCLKSIFEETENISFEVILIDNASQDGTVEMVREKFPSVLLMGSKENLGFAKGNNIAIPGAKGRYVLLLNPDTFILDRALEKMARFMDAHSEYDACGCKLLYPDGTLQESCRRFPGFWSQFFILLKLHNFFPRWACIGKYYMKDFKYDEVCEVDQVMGACLMARKGVFEKVGLLDEHFWAWFEEVDWCLRLKKTGGKLVFFPGAEIIHHKGQSFNQYWRRQWLFNTSMLTYFKKHHSFLSYTGIFILMPFNLLLDRLVALLLFLKIPIKKKKNL